MLIITGAETRLSNVQIGRFGFSLTAAGGWREKLILELLLLFSKAGGTSDDTGADDVYVKPYQLSGQEDVVI